MNKNLWQKAIFVCSLIVALISISFSVSAASASIKLNKTSASLYAGGIVQLKATVKGSSSTVKWSTSNKSVATVTTKGKVTAKKATGNKIVHVWCVFKGAPYLGSLFDNGDGEFYQTYWSEHDIHVYSHVFRVIVQ